MTLVAKGSTSRSYFERVMINKFVDIEGGVEIQRIHVVDLLKHRCIRREPWEQMCPTNDGVNMNDAHVAHTSAGGFRLHDPLASAGIWFVARRVPTNKRTRVIGTVVRESEEEIDTCHKKPLQSKAIRVPYIDENTIPAWTRDVTPRPERCRADNLSVHPSRARWVAWCTKRCSS